MFGSIEIKGGDQDYEGKVERLAVDSCNLLMFASVIADAGLVKAIRATLNSDKKCGITVTGIMMTNQDGTTKGSTLLGKTLCGYTTHLHRLGCNQVQAFFVSKWTGVLLSLADDHLWRRLCQTDYSTPMLEEWLPYIKAQMFAKQYLRGLYNFNCEVGILNMTTANLDEIVSQGIREGKIAIPERKTA